MRSVAVPRPGYGASSRRRKSSSEPRSRGAARLAVAAAGSSHRVAPQRAPSAARGGGSAADDGDGRGADAKDLGRLRILDDDAHREPLRDVHPRELAPDLGQPGRDRLVFGVHRPADPLHRTAEAVPRIGQHVHLRVHSGRDPGRDPSRGSSPRRTMPARPPARTPASGPARRTGRRGMQIDDPRVERRAHAAVAEIELGLAERRLRRVALRLERDEVADVLLGLILLPSRLVEPGLRGELRGARLVHLVRASRTPSRSSGSIRSRLSEEFFTCASARRTAALAASTAKRWPSICRCVTSISPSSAATSARARCDRELVRARVDDEQQIALSTAWLSATWSSLIVPLTCGTTSMTSAIDDRVVRLRIPHDTLHDERPEPTAPPRRGPRRSSRLEGAARRLTSAPNTSSQVAKMRSEARLG